MGTHPIFESDFDCLTDTKMTKRRNVTDLNEIVIECMKKEKYEKSLKLFQRNIGGATIDSNTCSSGKLFEKFKKYLEEQESEKENKKKENDDLGFEINFGAYQSDPKLPTGDSR